MILYSVNGKQVDFDEIEKGTEYQSVLYTKHKKTNQLVPAVRQTHVRGKENLVEELNFFHQEITRTDNLVVLPDYPLRTEMIKYRQELREFINHPDFPEIERPIAPD